MPNWTESMQQKFEYYVVNTNTWEDEKPINNVKSCTISWDLETETLGSATIDTTDSLGECYVRVYLITIQNGVEEKHPLGTFLVQTPNSNSDGKSKNISADAYTPLLELKEKYPDIGFYIPKKSYVMMSVWNILKNNNIVRAPVVKTQNFRVEKDVNGNVYKDGNGKITWSYTADPDDTILSADFVADPSDNWLSFLSDLMTNAKYSFRLDEMGNILFAPSQDLAALTPIVTFDSGNSSILYPDITIDRDLYGIPNVVEVICSSTSADGTAVPLYYKAKNEDPDSPVSIINRGREVVYRETNPSIIGTATQERVQEYAIQLLKDLSSIEHTVTYKHGYYPVRVGDCVRLDYPEAGLDNVKAKVISQSISCEPGCPVSEKAVYATKYWG